MYRADQAGASEGGIMHFWRHFLARSVCASIHKNLFTSSTTCVIITVTNTNGTRETMSFPSGFQRGSASGCKRSTRQEVDTPRQPVPRLQGTRHDLVTGR